MSEVLPDAIRICLTDAATRLGRALENLEWPSGGKDAAPAEINALINLMFFLQSQPRPFDIYAEGTCAGGRIDMMAYDGETALAVEAKNFGAINRQAELALNDLERMKEFRPSLTSGLASGELPRPWWADARQRWGIILIQSFRGREIAQAWQSSDDTEFYRMMSTYSASDRPQTDDAGQPSGLHKLYRAFAHQNRGAALITKADRWTNCGEGWFLWGAVPLSA